MASLQLGGGRHLSLRCGRRSGVQRHTVEHIVDISASAQILDVLVPQMGNQLLKVLKRLDTATPEQVIAVPRISHDRIPHRFVDWRRPQKAEQLVEAQTVVCVMSWVKVVFRTFPRSKKYGGRREFECEGARTLELTTPAGHEEPKDSVEWVQLSDDATSKIYNWNRRTRQ